jgi:DNA-binding FrmR family transcriptional regulator
MAHHKKPEISKRMARIEGHVKGIRKMLEEDKSYPEIVQQISTVRGALDSVVEVIVQDLVEHYVSQTTADTPGRDTALELKETVSNIL